VRAHLLAGTARLPDLAGAAAPPEPSDYERWRAQRDRFLADRSRTVVSLWCIPCGKDVATLKLSELGEASLTRFAIEARDHDNSLSCGGPYEFVRYARKRKPERRRLEGVPRSDPRQLAQWRALIELLFQRLNL